MTSSTDRRIRPGAVVGIAALGVAGATLATSLAAGAVAVTMARRIVTPPVDRDEDLRILAVSDATITLSPTEDSLTPGQYSLWFNRSTGHARIGEILAVIDHRKFHHIGGAKRGRRAGSGPAGNDLTCNVSVRGHARSGADHQRPRGRNDFDHTGKRPLPQRVKERQSLAQIGELHQQALRPYGKEADVILHLRPANACRERR